MDAKRLAILQPHAALPQIQFHEDHFVAEAKRLTNWEMESLQDQLRQGISPMSLVLPIAPQKKLVSALATLLAEVGILGVSTAQSQISKSAMLRQVTEFVAVQRTPEPFEDGALHYPQAGLRWYQDYSLKLAGVQQSDALERAKAVIAEGIAQGQTTRDMMAALAVIFPRFSNNRLENIARTETGKIYEQAKWQEFDAEPEVVGYEFVAILDERTTDMCRHRHGHFFPKDQIEGNMPPLHFRCRSTIVPVFSWEAEAKGFEWQPVPDNAAAPINGFGSTSMVIPDPSKAQAKMVRRIGRP